VSDVSFIFLPYLILVDRIIVFLTYYLLLFSPVYSCARSVWWFILNIIVNIISLFFCRYILLIEATDGFVFIMSWTLFHGSFRRNVSLPEISDVSFHLCIIRSLQLTTHWFCLIISIYLIFWAYLSFLTFFTLSKSIQTCVLLLIRFGLLYS